MASATEATFAPPVMEARRWIAGVTFPADRPLINVSQAAPLDPPHEDLRAELARIVLSETEAHLYGPVLGLPELRAEVAQSWSSGYGGTITPAHVAITSGCNQAFTATLAALCGPGDEVIVPLPFYFNHAMALDMASINAVYLPPGPGLLPDPAEAAARITPRTRAIVLVTPNNPAGVEYPADLVRAFYDLAKTHGLALIVDETYRDFDSRTGAPHDLFTDPDWDETLVQLYSFSKAYRLTGHRVGAMTASPARLAEAEKYLDTVAICPGGIGQRAALWGMRNLGQWLARERDEILARRAAIAEGFAPLQSKGWALEGLGAYFAYVAHPFETRSDDLARQMVREAGILCLPGTMFMPGGKGGEHHLRIAFANIDQGGIGTLLARLSDMTIA